MAVGGFRGFPAPQEVDIVVRCMLAKGYQSYTVTLLPAPGAPGCYEVVQTAVPLGEGIAESGRGLYRPDDNLKDREAVYRTIVQGEPA